MDNVSGPKGVGMGVVKSAAGPYVGSQPVGIGLGGVWNGHLPERENLQIFIRGRMARENLLNFTENWEIYLLRAGTGWSAILASFFGPLGPYDFHWKISLSHLHRP